jgi:hypothetical protein
MRMRLMCAATTALRRIRRIAIAAVLAIPVRRACSLRMFPGLFSRCLLLKDLRQDRLIHLLC